MKAFIVTDTYSDENYAAVVFAENKGKAKSTALHTAEFYDSDFTGLRCRRVPSLDKEYKDGKWYMDWEYYPDRIALVKELDWYCDPYEVECDFRCPAKKYCSRYKNMKDDEI